MDLFRLAAVMLVVANHTSPLVSVSPLWDFWFTRVLARVAVPFFLMVSGYFLAKDQWRRTGVFLKKTCLLYGAAMGQRSGSKSSCWMGPSITCGIFQA